LDKQPNHDVKELWNESFLGDTVQMVPKAKSVYVFKEEIAIYLKRYEKRFGKKCFLLIINTV